MRKQNEEYISHAFVVGDLIINFSILYTPVKIRSLGKGNKKPHSEEWG